MEINAFTDNKLILYEIDWKCQCLDEIMTLFYQIAILGGYSISNVNLSTHNCYFDFHPDMSELESQLEEAKDARMKMIVSDGVFSMDGSVTPLK